MFVTETFSVGINMPTKCVVFGELQKFDGTQERCLTPEEYCQMSGRAGRRGKDSLGTVIYFPCTKNMVSLSDFAGIVKGTYVCCVEIQNGSGIIITVCGHKKTSS